MNKTYIVTRILRFIEKIYYEWEDGVVYVRQSLTFFDRHDLNNS